MSTRDDDILDFDFFDEEDAPSWEEPEGFDPQPPGSERGRRGRGSGFRPPRNLTPGSFQHQGVAWLADSSGVVTSSARHETWDRDFCEDLYLVPLDGDLRPLTKQTGNYGSPSRRCFAAICRRGLTRRWRRSRSPWPTPAALASSASTIPIAWSTFRRSPHSRRRYQVDLRLG